MRIKTSLLAASAAVFVTGVAQAQTLKLIPTDPAVTSTGVFGINNAGLMTGTEIRGGAQVGFVRDASGAYTGFSIDKNNFVRSIDNAGDVIGYATDSSGQTATDEVFVRAPDGTVTIVQNPVTGTNLHGLGSAENAFGVLVGDYTPVTPGPQTGFLLDGSSLTTLQAPGATRTSARGIEDDGTIAGWAAVGGVDKGYILLGGIYSFFQDPNATAGAATFFEAINNHGMVAGQWQDASGDDHPFEFDSTTGVFTDIVVPGASGVDAFGINDGGYIVLNATVGGREENFLYNAQGVPEPAAWALMLGGFFGVGSALRRRLPLAA
jgi:VCBS repeat-containing protein